MEETDLVAVSVEASNDKESSKEDEEGKKAVKQRRLVLLGSCIVIFTTAPFITVFTLLYRRKLEDFSSTSSFSVGSWTFLLCLTSWNFFSLFTAPLIALRSHRWTCACGVLLLSSGVALSAFASSPADLLLSAGAVAGAGSGLATNPAVLVVTSHYAGSDRLGAAVGVLFTAMAVAGIAAPLAVGAGVSAEGDNADRHCAVAYAAFVAVGAAGAALFYPPPKAPQHSGEAKKPRRKYKCPIARFFSYVEWHLLRDSHFLVLSLGSSLTLVCMLNFYHLLPIVAASSSSSSAAGLLAVVSAVDLFSRFFTAWLGDWKVVKAMLGRPRKVIYALCGLAIGVIMISLPWCEGYGEFAFASAAFGAFSGALYATAPLVYQESFPAHMESALGLSCAFRAAGALVLAPIFGALRGDESSPGESAAPVLWLSGGISVALMLSWLLHEACSTQQQQQQQQKQQQEQQEQQQKFP